MSLSLEKQTFIQLVKGNRLFLLDPDVNYRIHKNLSLNRESK
jgi:hypothetical protein